MVRIIHAEDFERVTRCVTFKQDVNFSELEKDLCGMIFNPALHPNGEPANGVLRKLLEDIEKLSNKQIGHIEKLYTFENEDEFGETYEDFYRSEWLEPTIASIESTAGLVRQLLASFPSKLNSGPKKEIWFLNLAHELAVIFTRYTGKKATTKSPSDNPYDPKHTHQPTEFQKFAEACCFALRFEVIPSFYSKLHAAKVELNKKVSTNQEC